MNTVLAARVRAASAEMNKPGCWRLALHQLLQASTQLLAEPEPDCQTARLTLDNLHLLYRWSHAMHGDEMSSLNRAVANLNSVVYPG